MLTRRGLMYNLGGASLCLPAIVNINNIMKLAIPKKPYYYRVRITYPNIVDKEEMICCLDPVLSLDSESISIPQSYDCGVFIKAISYKEALKTFHNKKELIVYSVHLDNSKCF